MTAKLLIIDDEDVFREDLAALLEQRGFTCRTAPDGEAGVVGAREFNPDVILCDMVMPGQDGIEVLGEVMRASPESLVIMVTAYGTLETAMSAFRQGASDYIIKPLILEDLLLKINRLLEYRRLAQEVKFLRRELSRDKEVMSLVGKHETMTNVLDLIDRVAPTRSTVLITGESGTGKELVARAIHQRAPDAGLPFVAINCAGIPESLLESELFGHVRGAFTGAAGERVGFFELAGEGTVLLDEIAEMPLSLQSKLLRVLEEKEFIRVGGTDTIPLRARVIASTNKDLRKQVEQAAFRADLFFRVAVFEIPLPALRERRSDIPLLVEHFVRGFNAELKRRCLGANNDAIRHLLAYDWPGNVRELRNIIERAMILQSGDYITPAELPPQVIPMQGTHVHTNCLRDAVQAYEREHIRRVIAASGGNKEEAARRLDVNPSTLYRKMSDLELGRAGPRMSGSD